MTGRAIELPQNIVDKDTQPLICRIDRRDLKEGVPDNPQYCPVARSISRRLKGRFVPLVSWTHLWVVERKSGTPRLRYALPDRMREWIQDYDRGTDNISCPVIFQLHAPAELLNSKDILNAKQQYNRNIAKSSPWDW